MEAAQQAEALDPPRWRATVADLLRRAGPWILVTLAVAAAVTAKRQAPWIPAAYLVALVGSGIVAWKLATWRAASTRVRAVGGLAAGLVLVALLPVPWMTAALDEPPGTAWRLDGSLHVNGERIDPAGAWYWLTVGRPPLVAEVVTSWLTGGDAPTSLRGGPPTSRPEVSEPAAAAVGLRAAGVPTDEVNAEIGGRLARTPVGRWFRSLALGRSHGLMVALVTYAEASGEDLARGRAIAGTGGIRDDGSVTRVGGLRSKATAAADLGIDVLLVPAEQVDQLDGLDLAPTRIVPVTHLDDAISALRADVG